MKKTMKLYVSNITIEGTRDITTVYVDLQDSKGKYIDTVVRKRRV